MIVSFIFQLVHECVVHISIGSWMCRSYFNWVIIMSFIFKLVYDHVVHISIVYDGVAYISLGSRWCHLFWWIYDLNVYILIGSYCISIGLWWCCSGDRQDFVTKNVRYLSKKSLFIQTNFFTIQKHSIDA